MNQSPQVSAQNQAKVKQQHAPEPQASSSQHPPGYNPNPHNLTAAQIENRKYSIYIKNLHFEPE